MTFAEKIPKKQRPKRVTNAEKTEKKRTILRKVVKKLVEYFLANASKVLKKLVTKKFVFRAPYPVLGGGVKESGF